MTMAWLPRGILMTLLLLLGGCTNIQLKPEAQAVRLYFDREPETRCRFIGEAVGTHGNMFTFIFIANEDLLESAINDLKNEAQAHGADSVFLMHHQLNFSSSVTLLGQMYRCN